LYKTVWEMSMKDIIDITSSWLFCRSIAIIELVYAKCKLFKIDINAFYAWQSGLKTGMYYLRTKAAIKFIEQR
jgi:ribonucleoside-diphosphate reductase alpha chain